MKPGFAAARSRQRPSVSPSPTSSRLNGSKGADTVVVPGLEAPWAPQDPAVLEAVARAAEDGARLVSLCAGAFVLGQAGVLDGRRVTTHWALADEFRAAFPRAHLIEHAMYVDDGQILSSGGMLASADLCLYLLSQDHGQAYANPRGRVRLHRVAASAFPQPDRHHAAVLP